MIADSVMLSFSHAWPSLLRIIFGVGLAFALGLLLAILRYALPKSLQENHFFNFIIEAPRFPPPIAWIPFVILTIGIGEFSSLSIVFIGAFFPVFTNTYNGMKGIPRAVVWTARSMELSRWRLYRYVLLKAALPQIMTGLRVAIGMGWMSVIAAEMVSGESGLGYSLQIERMNMQYGLMAWDMALIALLGYLLTVIMSFIEKRALIWMDVH